MEVALWSAAFAVGIVVIGLITRFGLGALKGVVEKVTGQQQDALAWDQLQTALAAVAQRAKDKFDGGILAAKQPDSEGGIEVTAKEMSRARQWALDELMAGLKGVPLEMAKSLGPGILKGAIGALLEKIIKPKIVKAA